MTKRLQAVYEGGILRPLEPLPLPEKRLVNVVVSDDEIPATPVRFVPAEEFSPYADDSITLEQVRQSLAGISGSLDDEFIAGRDERF